MKVFSYPTNESDWSDIERVGPGEIIVSIPTGSLDLFSPVDGVVTALDEMSPSALAEFGEFMAPALGPLAPPAGSFVVTIVERGTTPPRTHRLSPVFSPVVAKGAPVTPGKMIGLLPASWRALDWKIQEGTSPVDPVSFLASRAAVSPDEARAEFAKPAPIVSPEVKKQDTKSGVIMGLLIGGLLLAWAARGKR